MAKPGELSSEGNQAVQRFWGPQRDAPDAYASLLDLMTPLGLRADNVRRKSRDIAACARPRFLCSVFCVRIPPRS
jgi:hypothetical protein